ncbi:MAG: hypothetical protein RLZZ444_4465 [Pseudomonadota bacterium]|jgi:uncharacterized membrane protein
MALFVAGLILFIGLHLMRVLAPELRENLIARFGKTAFRAVHGILSIVFLALLAYGFGEARQETGILYVPPVFTAHITLLLMLFAAIIFASGLMPAGYIKTYTKFPVTLSVKIWALAHLLANGETVQVILFAAFLAWAAVLRISYKRRVASGDVALPVYKSWIWDIAAVVIGGAFYLAMFKGLHEWLIGVPVLVM